MEKYMKSFLAKNLVLAAICLSTTATMYSMDFRGSDSDNEDCMHSRKCQKEARHHRKHHEEACDPRVNVDLSMTECGKISYKRNDAIEKLEISLNLRDSKMLNVHACLLPGTDEGTIVESRITDALNYLAKTYMNVSGFRYNHTKKRDHR